MLYFIYFLPFMVNKDYHNLHRTCFDVLMPHCFSVVNVEISS